MNAAYKKLEEIINDLPEESQAKIIDFAEFLREKKNAASKPKTSRKKSAFSVCIKDKAGSATISTTSWATNFGSAKTLG